MSNKRKISMMFLIFIIITSATTYILLKFLPYGEYENSDFNIPQYISMIDKDNDGIDDQTDILNSAKEYIQSKPKYESKYYAGGYPDDEYGVCTDVVGISMLNSGYNLMELVNQDIMDNQLEYNIETIDKNIDFRRVRNLDVYFKNTAIQLTTDINEIEQWQGGDIVVFKDHIGIVSDRRNKNGIPYVIHHANPYQVHYEENVLELYRDIIIGHYRIS